MLFEILCEKNCLLGHLIVNCLYIQKYWATSSSRILELKNNKDSSVCSTKDQSSD